MFLSREMLKMTFGEKLKQLRTASGETQDTVAKAIGVTKRAYVAYELNNVRPRNKERLEKIAEHFNVDVNYLYMENELFVEAAKEKYGARGAQQARTLTNELAGMFAGGELTDEDKDAVMQALQKAYWTAKEANEKYASKTR